MIKINIQSLNYFGEDGKEDGDGGHVACEAGDDGGEDAHDHDDDPRRQHAKVG